MPSISPTHRTTRRLWPFAVALLLPILSGNSGVAQTPSPAFWELRPEKVTEMLLPVPGDDHQRFTRLRQYFTDLHCLPALMEEQTIQKHHAGKNLICVLPGKDKDTEQILVAVRYDHRERMNGQSGWNEAVMLPLLYKALQAQDRQHTFIFAELYGGAGQTAFFDRFRKNGQHAPEAIVVLDRLGLSQPWFYAPPATRLSAKGRERNAMNNWLESEAVFTARLQKMPLPGDATPEATDNTLLFDAYNAPSILIYSVFHRSVPDQAFHQDFEFLAYYLCKIDAELSNQVVWSSAGK